MSRHREGHASISIFRDVFHGYLPLEQIAPVPMRKDVDSRGTTNVSGGPSGEIVVYLLDFKVVGTFDLGSCWGDETIGEEKAPEGVGPEETKAEP